MREPEAVKAAPDRPRPAARTATRSVTGSALAASVLAHAAALVAFGSLGGGDRLPSAPSAGPLVVHVSIAPMPVAASAPVVHAEVSSPPGGRAGEGFVRQPRERRAVSPMSPPEASSGLVETHSSPAPEALALVAPVPADGAGQATSIAPPSPARYRETPQPEYPRQAREEEREGVVVLRVRVSVEGRPAEILLESSSGDESLDRAAIAGVGRWTFTPARRDGHPIEAWMRVPVRFRLG